MMDELLAHDATRKLIDAYLKQPVHALLLSGPVGVGLHTLATAVAAKLDPQTTIHEVMPDEKGTIAIETVRGLYRLGRTGRQSPLVIIIDDAEAMGREAQNALLKMLEEPSSGIYFILTSHTPQLLLQTILSRLRRIDVLPLSPAQSERLITMTSNRAQLLFLANGLPAELVRLQADEKYFQHQSELMKDARTFLQSDTYGKIAVIAGYSANRASAEEFVRCLLRLICFMLLHKEDLSLLAPLERIQDTVSRLRQNAHAKTQLLYVVTAFSPSGIIRN